MGIKEIFNCDPASMLGVVLVAVLGSWLSYKFGRHNTRIDEFNRLRDEIAPLFKAEAENPDPLFYDIDENKLEILSSLMYPWQKKGFTESLDAYQTTKGGNMKPGNYPGLLAYEDPEPVAVAAAKVLSYLKRR